MYESISKNNELENEMTLDMSYFWYSDVDDCRFKDCEWSEYYPDAVEAIPRDMPKPRGKAVMCSCFVDADLAGCQATRRLHTCMLIFVNSAPILWCSKRQNTFQPSTFGFKFVAIQL